MRLIGWLRLLYYDYMEYIYEMLYLIQTVKLWKEHSDDTNLCI